ncbi:tyrosine-type recombinase/integrase [Brevibacterium pigmentatum]|uniref:tyrosine-type recombinase/integrase n=1 Tax=Brevibacterium pigmentatum TaxID=1496080 RepID=UPI001423C7AE|nr:tyrosine-type recombinase/integrase [Brevibacterium pigmentatum]
MESLASWELRYAIQARTEDPDGTKWDMTPMRKLIELMVNRRISSFMDLEVGIGQVRSLGMNDSRADVIARGIVTYLRVFYSDVESSKEEGILYLDHFGHSIPGMLGTVDLRMIPQRWLRDAAWDYLRFRIEGPNPPRVRAILDTTRRSAIELGAFLEQHSQFRGHRPAELTASDAQSFVRDYRRRMQKGLPSRALKNSDGSSARITANTYRYVLNGARQILRHMVDNFQDESTGLSREFVVEFPFGTINTGPQRRAPLSDDTYRAVCDAANLDAFEQNFDASKLGLRDVWETILYTGRRASEIIRLRFDCLQELRGTKVLKFSETKVGLGETSIPIPEVLYQRLQGRQVISRSRIEARLGRSLTAEDEAKVALFPSNVRNPHCLKSISYGGYSSAFRDWITSLDLGPVVNHQARHTIATRLLRAGASTTHIKHFLGHVSERMTEHYVHIANEDLERTLMQVWVDGPGANHPGAATKERVHPAGEGGSTVQTSTLTHIDLMKSSSPTEGGLCLYQPVVRGGECPWKLNCSGCKHFVMTGADLVYWRRKREQWLILAEAAPSDSAREYMHEVVEPLNRALKGLEVALRENGLLEEASNLDMRRPQNFFRPIWNHGYEVAEERLRGVDGEPVERS